MLLAWRLRLEGGLKKVADASVAANPWRFSLVEGFAWMAGKRFCGDILLGDDSFCQLSGVLQLLSEIS